MQRHPSKDTPPSWWLIGCSAAALVVLAGAGCGGSPGQSEGMTNSAAHHSQGSGGAPAANAGSDEGGGSGAATGGAGHTQGGGDDGTPPAMMGGGGTPSHSGEGEDDDGHRADAGTGQPRSHDGGTMAPPPAADAGQTPPPPPAADAGQTPPPPPTPDAGTPQSTCIPAVAAGPSSHNPGMNCNGCHNWSVAGTLFSALTGGTGVSGATIEVTDSAGVVVRLATGPNGNFYTSQALTPPLHVRASQCPSDAPMISTLTNGSCASCHNSTFQVHLP